MKKKIVILFGGVSPEHEVSIITGLQVLEQIDKSKYIPLVVYLTKDNLFKLMAGLYKRSDFTTGGGDIVHFGRDKNGVFVAQEHLVGLSKKYFDCAYLAFHGGSGESGPIQGSMETLGVPYTSSGVESSCITMNKSLTKEVLLTKNIETVKGISVNSVDIRSDVDKSIRMIKNNFSFPLIIKPVHLGSSIGISIAKTKIELKKALLEASYMDNEILVESFIKDFTEYNCSVRLINHKLEVSEVERPLSKDEILSFADKYQRGGNKKQSGMASLNRELPAKISEELRKKLQNIAIEVFRACRCKGMVRVDFMVSKSGKIFVTEVNPIPGSMAFYLWEATGISFTEQITDLIEQAIKDEESRKSKSFDYESDIVEKFIKS